MVVVEGASVNEVTAWLVLLSLLVVIAVTPSEEVLAMDIPWC